MAQSEDMTEMITQEQKRLIKTVAGKLGIETDAMAIGFSSGRTKHVSELYKKEAMLMCNELKKMQPKSKDDSADKMRKKIFHMWYLRAGLPDGANARQKRNVQEQALGWVEKYGYLHKPLDRYTQEELPKLVTQAERALKSLIIRF